MPSKIIPTQPALTDHTRKHTESFNQMEQNEQQQSTKKIVQQNGSKLQQQSKENGTAKTSKKKASNLSTNIVAPAHINIRSSSQPLREPYLQTQIPRNLEYTLVLDLDETLVHFDPKIRTYRPRPGALKFLSELYPYYELVVFTAGLKDYADWILNDFDR